MKWTLVAILLFLSGTTLVIGEIDQQRSEGKMSVTKRALYGFFRCHARARLIAFFRAHLVDAPAKA